MDTDPQVTIENCGAFLLDKFIDLAFFLPKIQVLKFRRLWREFNQLLAIERTFLVPSKQNSGATEDTSVFGMNFDTPTHNITWTRLLARVAGNFSVNRIAGISAFIQFLVSYLEI